MLTVPMAILGGLLIFLRKLFAPHLYIIVITITFVISIFGFPKLLLVFLGEKFQFFHLLSLIMIFAGIYLFEYNQVQKLK